MRAIRNILAYSFALFLIFFGFVRRAKNKAINSGKITPLYFHNPSRKLFEKCIKWLKKNSYVFISTGELIEILNKQKPPVNGAVWLTFDDGWKENVTDVVPFAVEQNIPVTIFISTGPVEGNGVFWWTYAEKFTNDLPLPYRNDINELWKIPESERKKIIDDLTAKHGTDVTRQAMTIDDVKEIAKIPQVTIGSHTVNHVITPNCTLEELDKEIGESKAKLEEWTGKEITCFTYPNGDINGKEIDVLKKYKFTLAATAENRLINPDDNLFLLPRFSVSNGSFLEEVCHMTCIWKPIIQKIKKVLK